MEMEENEYVSTRSVGLKFGAISGVLGILSTVLQDVLNMHQSTVFQVSGFVIIVVFIILAHRDYKANGDGFMEYGQGVGIGFWYGLVSSAISSGFMFIYISFISSSFMEAIREQQIVALEEQGLTDSQIEQQMEMMEAFSGPPALLIFGILGVTLFSVIGALIISAFTKKARPEFE